MATTFALDHEDWNKLFILLHLARSKNWKLYIWINAFVLSPSLLLWTTGWHSTLLSGRKRLTTLHSDFSSVSAKYHGSRGNIEEYWSNRCKQRWIILFLHTFKLISNLPFSPQYLADTGERGIKGNRYTDMDRLQGSPARFGEYTSHQTYSAPSKPTD